MIKNIKIYFLLCYCFSCLLSQVKNRQTDFLEYLFLSKRLIAPSFYSVNYSEKKTAEKHINQSDTSSSISPTKAMLRSAIIPGWGHLYGKKPVKGLIYLSAEIYFVYRAFYFHDIYKHVKNTEDHFGKEVWLEMSKTEKNQAVRDHTGYNLKMNYWRPKERRNKRIWWCGGIYIMSMLDAFVDAHLADFPEGDMEFINDVELETQGVRFSFVINGGK